jgi:hypothetical protein
MKQAYKLNIVNKADLTFNESPMMIEDEITPETIMAQVNPELVAACTSYHFNIFRFSETVGRKNQMPILSYSLLKVNGIEESVNKQKFFSFMKAVYNRYSRNVQYHNDLHGSEVAQHVSFMLNQRGINGIGLNDIDVLSLLVASFTHDMGHDGFTNGFHKNANSDRYINYSDHGAQEGYHAATTILLLDQDKHDIFAR